MQQFEFPYEISLKAQMPEGTQRLLDAAEAAAGQGADAAPGKGAALLTGAALLLSDGSVVTGSGQAGGACAERAALGAHDASGPAKVKAIAIAFHPGSGDQQPLVPCGVCREAILDMQLRQDKAITVFMSAPDGEVIMVEDAAYLLPFYTGKGKYT